MSWRDNLRQASFRGAKFKVMSHGYSFGRRNVIHQYPFKDETYAEDLGMDADEFTIEAYIVQTVENNFDYFGERDALIKALKEIGPGKLVHPFLGEKTVVPVGKQSIKETFTEGGWARFDLQFVISGKNDFPQGIIDPVTSVDKAAENIIDVSADNFYAQWETEDKPSWVVQSAYNDFIIFTNSMKATISGIRAASGSSLETVKSTFDTTVSAVYESIHYPCQVAGYVTDIFDSVLGIANLFGGETGEVIGHCSGRIFYNKLDPGGKKVSKQLGYSMTNALIAVAGSSDSTGFGVSPADSESSIGGALEDISVTTETRARQAANRMAFINLVRSQALSAAMRAAIRITYDSLQQMRAMQESLIASLDNLLIRLGDESATDPYSDYGILLDHRDLYSGLEDLRGVFIQAMRENGLNIAVELVIESPPDGITSLQLAYDRYNDLNREDEIYIRNKESNKHPGFLIGDLKVLSN